MPDWRQIIIHHSLTKDGLTVDWQAIRRFHTSWRRGGNIITPQEAQVAIAGQKVEAPWSDIGYHAGIERINGQLEALIGRPTDRIGAHTVGMNTTALGVMFTGNFDLAPPDDETLRYGIDRIVWPWMRAFHIPMIGVRRHSEFAQKSCPGRLFPWQKFLSMISAKLAQPVTT